MRVHCCVEDCEVEDKGFDGGTRGVAVGSHAVWNTVEQDEQGVMEGGFVAQPWSEGVGVTERSWC